MSLIKKGINTVKTGVSKMRTYWRTPPLGNYMNYKEIVSLSVGGFGVKTIITFVQAAIISANNAFVGNTIGIKPMQMYAIYVASVLVGFPLTMLRAKIIDNSRSRKGKYRPYIISMGLPTVLLSIGYIWAPYEHMGDIGKIATVVFFNIGFQFFYNFLYDAYDNYVSVLSSNTQERSNVLAIRAVSDSLAPTIINAVVPIIGEIITGKRDLYDIRIYRYVWTPLLIIGFLISFVLYKNTKEKIIQARTHVVRIKFIDAFRAVMKNKYFWIISLAGWVGFLESMANSILGWLYTYQNACTSAQYALLTTIYGNASFWGMLLAPFSIKKFGKKNTLIFTNAMNIVFIAALYPVVKYADASIMIWLAMMCLWMNALVGSFAHILTPSLNADIRDYQQYVTGERIDGMFAAVGLIGSVVTMATTSVQSAIYEVVGFNDAKLAELMPEILASGVVLEQPDNVYNVLYHRPTFISIFAVLIMTAVVGAAMNVIPYFFYDLSEVKQKGMVKVLQVRALFEDYGRNALSDKDLVKAIELVREAREYSVKEKLPVDKSALKAAKTKEEKKAARKARKQALEHNEKIIVSQFVVDELNRFNTVQGKAQLENAKLFVAEGINHTFTVTKADLAAAKVLSTATEEEKAYRKAEITRIKECLYAKKVAKKHFPNGLDIEKVENTAFDKLFEQEDAINEKIDKAYDAYYKARDEKNKPAAEEAMALIKQYKAEAKEIEKALKKATDDSSLFNRAAKPYTDAKKLVVMAENYTHYDEIAAMYDEAKVRYEEAERLAAEEAARKEAAEKEHAAQLRANRKNKK
ncbi:MAG: MFS transporter [Clostridia bacterium]|nr:MFS transporter [Clostridia bacterium]